ncbi:hypothetical protein L1049_004932 [Liquidambar formosana]|uniref:SWIM-type domain-containing protein n=1 Tax=Liquidambar formosana TaxID=63359 RepID=A0AAP0RPA6_LIQFO
MCETFNGYILEAKDKHIITLIEMVRQALITRMTEKREGMLGYRGPICPKIQGKVEKLKSQSRKCTSHWAGGGLFEVRCHPDTFVVNLEARTCSCKKWDLIGIPYKHAISSIAYKKENVEDYVDACYSVKTYMHCYSRMTYPVRSQKFWDETRNPLVLPPSQRRPPGQPKKLRRREVDEPQNPFKLRRNNAKIKCSRC